MNRVWALGLKLRTPIINELECSLNVLDVVVSCCISFDDGLNQRVCDKASLWGPTTHCVAPAHDEQRTGPHRQINNK
jgi:hypothetical protein